MRRPALALLLGCLLLVAGASADVVIVFNSTGTTSWTVPDGVNEVEVLVVAGGGGGGASGVAPGGGGAGGLIYNPAYSVTPGQSITVTVGAGGSVSNNGENSVFGTLTAIGGGQGGDSTAWNNAIAGSSGGSGGGGGSEFYHSSAGGSGVSGQGYAGGTGREFGDYRYAGGGGGGAGGVGLAGATNGGDGGPGLCYSISGAETYYAGGGGGRLLREGGAAGVHGAGGIGGGGAAGVAGTANTGGGGGAGAAGGSGIVIVRHVDPAAPPVTAFTATPTAGLAPLTVQFTDTSTGRPTSWAWTFGDGGTSTAQNPQHTYAAPGTYTVTLTATNEYGSTPATKLDYITVYGPITAQFTATPTGGTAPLIVQFTDLSAGGPTSWSWTFGDGNTSTAQNPQHTYTTAGTHTVTLTASHPYDSDTETKTAYITVAVLQPFPGLTLIPRDLAGTGLYTDINGNNRLDYNDLTIFFQNLAWAKTAQPTECFDFNGNNRLDYNDVITLFTTISGGA